MTNCAGQLEANILLKVEYSRGPISEILSANHSLLFWGRSRSRTFVCRWYVRESGVFPLKSCFFKGFFNVESEWKEICELVWVQSHPTFLQFFSHFPVWLFCLFLIWQVFFVLVPHLSLVTYIFFFIWKLIFIGLHSI